MTVREFLDSLREGKYSSVGSYPLYWVTSDGGVLSYEACRAEVWRIARAIRDWDWDSGGWRVTGYDVNWEDPELYCDHTNKRIESTYAEELVGAAEVEL